MKTNRTPLLPLLFSLGIHALVLTGCNNDALSLSDNTAQTSEQKDTTEKKEKNMKQEKKEKTEKKEKKPTPQPTSDAEAVMAQYKKADAYTILDTKSLTKEELSSFFTIQKISDRVFDRMYKKSYKEDCTVPRSELRYLRVLHADGEGNTRIGELVVNKSIAKDCKEIFYKLYKRNYPIEKMVLVDEYDADDNESMADNNTSSFNYRVVEGTTNLSKHSLGLAIDINPRYNPYIHTLNGEVVCSPANGADYQDRTKEFPYKIDTEDYAYQLFTSYGFQWGGAWNSSKDYQHFQKE